ncbi:hypothetical protein DFH06DRAFT_449599 [Mycena polygramma]|nr:hypothetical protein DFH06DRAFT_449599 [Mycena polygramma]
MPPLTRQRTLESIHSWWSDNNPVGATISIHALAKPLMRMMYHSDAREFIKRNHGNPMSKDDRDIYLGYLECKYVSSATKTLILGDFHRRASSSEDEARTVADCLVADPQLIGQLLTSMNANIQCSACTILGSLSAYESTARAILSLEPCEPLVELLSDRDVCVRRSSIEALCHISFRAGGERPVVDAKVRAIALKYSINGMALAIGYAFKVRGPHQAVG